MHRFLALLNGPNTPEALGIADLPDLAARVQAGGLDVHLESTAADVTGGISTTVYRVVQEALTNVVRHSDARSARVVVRRDGPILFAQVCDDGQTVEARTPGAGRGLSGLAERVRVFDGTVTSGRTPSGWEVEARIPLDSTTP